MINGAVAFLVGLFLIVGLWNDRSTDIIATIQRQSGFVKWAGALLTLSYIYNATDGKGGEVIKALTILALIAMVLGKGQAMFGEVEKLFGSDKNGR